MVSEKEVSYFTVEMRFAIVQMLHESSDDSVCLVSAGCFIWIILHAAKVEQFHEHEG